MRQDARTARKRDRKREADRLDWRRVQGSLRDKGGVRWRIEYPCGCLADVDVVCGVFRVVDHDDPDRTVLDVVHVAHRVVVVEPNAGGRWPPKRVPAVIEGSAWRNAVALLERSRNTDARPSRRFPSR